MLDAASSFRIDERPLAYFSHFHPEAELVLIVTGRGHLTVGDSVVRYDEGDILLLGSDLPHHWQPDPDATPERSICVHFRAHFLGDDSWNAPELEVIRLLFARAAHGLRFDRTLAADAAQDLLAAAQRGGSPALARLLIVLDHLAQAPGSLLTGSLASFAGPTEFCLRLERVCGYLEKRFCEPLNLRDIAAVAAMSPSAFSRYFKSAMGKNVSEYLTELRIGHAAELLLGSDAKIGDIAFSTGFETLSSFNRQFLRIQRIQPRQYRRKFRTGYWQNSDPRRRPCAA